MTFHISVLSSKLHQEVKAFWVKSTKICKERSEVPHRTPCESCQSNKFNCARCECVTVKALHHFILVC